MKIRQNISVYLSESYSAAASANYMESAGKIF